MTNRLSEMLVTKKYMDSVIESMIETVIFVSADYTIKKINLSGLKILGYMDKELQGKPLDFLLAAGHNAETLIDKARTEPLEIDFIAKHGGRIPVIFSASMVDADEGQFERIICVATEISKLKRTEEKLREKELHLAHLAYHDPLTGLPNRLLFHDRLSQAIASCRRSSKGLALFFLDLDRFKNINDTLGHRVGDLILVEMSLRLKNLLRQTDTVARLGGDEFVIIIPDIEHSRQVSELAVKILRELSKEVRIEAQLLHLTTSIGISLFPGQGDNEEALMRNADVAMYHAKAQGRNNFQIYSADIDSHAKEVMSLENELRMALGEEQLSLHYQPQVDLDSGLLVGMEALVRWKHPTRGYIPPDVFIPIAEDSGLIHPLGDWILGKACQKAVEWQKQGLADMLMAVNISAKQFSQPDFLNKLRAVIHESGINPNLLELEITESTLMEQIDGVVGKMRSLRELGVHISIDDFGTGFSSLGYLKTFPINKLKIDKSFVHDLTTDPNDAAIVSSIISLANSMNLMVVAEGIETGEQLQFLKSKGCHVGQGYYFCPPLAEQDLESKLVGEGHRPAWRISPHLQVISR